MKGLTLWDTGPVSWINYDIAYPHKSSVGLEPSWITEKFLEVWHCFCYMISRIFLPKKSGEKFMFACRLGVRPHNNENISWTGSVD